MLPFVFVAEDSSKTDEAAKDGEKEVRKESEPEKNSKEPVKANSEVNIYYVLVTRVHAEHLELGGLKHEMC